MCTANPCVPVRHPISSFGLVLQSILLACLVPLENDRNLDFYLSRNCLYTQQCNNSFPRLRNRRKHALAITTVHFLPLNMAVDLVTWLCDVKSITSIHDVMCFSMYVCTYVCRYVLLFLFIY